MCLLNPLYNTPVATAPQNNRLNAIPVTFTTLSLILLLPLMFIFSLSLEQKPVALEWSLRNRALLPGPRNRRILGNSTRQTRGCQDFWRFGKANDIAHLVNPRLRGRGKRVKSYTVVYTKR